MRNFNLSAEEKQGIGLAVLGIVTIPILLYWFFGDTGLQVASIITAGLLSLSLVVLYYQQYSVQSKQTSIQREQTEIQRQQTEIQNDQTSIQGNQESLMEQQFKPYLTGEVAPLNITSAQFLLKNSGEGPAYRVKAEWTVAGETRTWESSSIAPEGEYSFPVIVDDGEWLLGLNETQEYLEDRGESPVIDYTITCENQLREEQKFEGSVDFELLIKRSDSDEIWNRDPIEVISNEMSKIQRNIGKIEGYQKKETKALDWQRQVQQVEILQRVVNEQGEMTITQLSTLTNISESEIRTRIRTLDSLGILHYDTTTDRVKTSQKSPNTAQLDDYKS